MNNQRGGEGKEILENPNMEIQIDHDALLKLLDYIEELEKDDKKR